MNDYDESNEEQMDETAWDDELSADDNPLEDAVDEESQSDTTGVDWKDMP